MDDEEKLAWLMELLRKIIEDCWVFGKILIIIWNAFSFVFSNHYLEEFEKLFQILH